MLCTRLSWLVQPFKRRQHIIGNYIGSSSIVQHFSSHNNENEAFSQPLSENDVVSEDFINRNPRNLERMGLARKQEGWKFQYPRQNHWYRLEMTYRKGFTAQVVHCSGEVIVQASTKEYAISKFLYSTSDRTSARTVGKVLAERCKQCGITEMVIDPQIEDHIGKDERYVAFLDTFTNHGITLEEKQRIVLNYMPGIDYDDKEAVDNIHERQRKVYALGDDHRSLNRMRMGSRKRHPYKQNHEPTQNFDPKKDFY